MERSWDFPMPGNNYKPIKKNSSRFLGIIILLAVAGIATYEWLLPILAEYLVKQEGSETTLTIIETILTLVFLSFIPIMFYLFAVYRKKISSEQYQPPGTNPTVPHSSSKVSRKS